MYYYLTPSPVALNTGSSLVTTRPMFLGGDWWMVGGCCCGAWTQDCGVWVVSSIMILGTGHRVFSTVCYQF